MARQLRQGEDVVYLVLESDGSKALLKTLYEKCESPVWQRLFSETQWAPYEDESPLVIQTYRNSDVYRWALKGLGKTGELSGLIVETDESFETLLHWARERLTVTLDGARKGLLRFYDPWIWHSLEPRDIGQQGIINSVVYLHGSPEDGEWLTSQNPEPVTMGEVPTLELEQLHNLGLASD